MPPVEPARSPRPWCVGLLACLLVGAAGCRGKMGIGGSSTPAAVRADAVFLAEAPAIVPDEVEPDLDAMGIKQLFVAAGTLSSSGQVKGFPPPPGRLKRPVVLVLVGESGSAGLARSLPPDVFAETLASGVRKLVAEAKGWSDPKGVHLHFLPSPADGELLGKALGALRGKLGGLRLSVTLPPGGDPAAWKPLAGNVDEALVFSYGRRPETNDMMMPELSEASAKAFPLPFRLLLALGGYGRASSGGSFGGRRIPDREIDALSEDKAIDFDFSAVLSNEPGSIYNFKPRVGYDGRQSLLSKLGGAAQFQTLPFSDAARLLSASSRWGAANLLGRVFLLDGVPRDGHLVGFGALRAYLTGKSFEPNLTIQVIPGKRGGEFSLRVGNPGQTASELSRFENWVRIRLEGAVLSSVTAGDFDRFELYASAADMTHSAPFGRATVCKLYENLFVPEEVNEVGPIRFSGGRPRVFVSYQLALPDGRSVKGPEMEVALAELREEKPKAQPPMPKLGRRR